MNAIVIVTGNDGTMYHYGPFADKGTAAQWAAENCNGYAWHCKELISVDANQMTYEEFQAYMARYGFTQCPLSEDQFKRAQAELGDAALFGVACDVNAGVAFATALWANARK